MTDVEFTQDWWRRCLSDEAKLNAWLVKLQITEEGGYHDWENLLIPIYNEGMQERTKTILHNIANDELKHSAYLVALLNERKVEAVKYTETVSQYWTEMYKHITSLETACAVNYYGEALAAYRFEIITEMPETPSDIKEFLRIALPDEQFHRETLKRLAGDAALELIKPHHDAAVLALRQGK
jgi:hypothetical protein